MAGRPPSNRLDMFDFRKLLISSSGGLVDTGGCSCHRPESTLLD